MDNERDYKKSSCETLCVRCVHACGGCSWADRFEPVKGWRAEETKISRNIGSYLVHDCPEFLPSHDRQGNKIGPSDPDSLDTEGCIRLINAIAKVAGEDYVLMQRERPAITKFFKGKFFQSLSNADPEIIVNGLKKLAAEHDRKNAQKMKNMSQRILEP